MGEKAESEAAVVAVAGATGPLGRRVVARLSAQGREVVALARSPARLEEASLAASTRRLVDFERAERAEIRRALDGAEAVVSCLYAHHLAALATALPPCVRRLVAVGSARRYNERPDAIGEAVRRAEALLLGLPLEVLVLHPTMIYGAESDATVARILALVRRFPVVPVPSGSRTRVQPVHVDDVAEALARGAVGPFAGSRAITAPGPEPMSYAALVKASARAAGRPVFVLPLPVPLLRSLAALARPWLGPDAPTGEELRRAAEMKALPAEDFAALLGRPPISFAEGLRRTLGQASGRQAPNGTARPA